MIYPPSFLIPRLILQPRPDFSRLKMAIFIGKLTRSLWWNDLSNSQDSHAVNCRTECMSHLMWSGLVERVSVCLDWLRNTVHHWREGSWPAFMAVGREGGGRRSPASRQYSCTHNQTHWQAGHSILSWHRIELMSPCHQRDIIPWHGNFLDLFFLAIKVLDECCLIKMTALQLSVKQSWR